MKLPLEILFEDNHLLAINKPAGLATMGVSEDEPSLVKLAKEYIGAKYQKPGNVYLGVVSRIDALVTGVVIFARTSKAAQRLTDMFRGRDVSKIYWGVVEGHVEPGAGELVDFLRKNEAQQRMETCRGDAPGAQEAKLRYRTLRTLGTLTAVEVDLLTGRKHQIRVQWSSRGHAMVGDAKYGSRTAFSHGIALHSRRLAFEHPVRRTPVEIFAPLPASWERWQLEEKI